MMKNRDDKAFSAEVPASRRDREAALRAFATEQVDLRGGSVEWQTVTADASSRRYFRLVNEQRSWICADSPPQTEKNEAFLSIRALLDREGLPVPRLLGADIERGFLVLEDFGDRHLLQALDVSRPSPDYAGALPLLLRLQGIEPDTTGLPEYSRGLLQEEFSRFYEWFCLRWLALSGRRGDADLVAALGERLIDSALEQPSVFVFRDYHSRNLLVQADGSLGLIDYQDAVIGPLCYDLASLLRDCYIRWPAHQVRQWALLYRQQLLAAGRSAGASDSEFLRWFDWMGLHRHLKVLGNFTRLALRDGRDAYLGDIPLVLVYIRDVLSRYPEFEEFARWFEDTLGPLLRRHAWETGG
jgi:aminoglycoside/choline kinase family phosphotransferase